MASFNLNPKNKGLFTRKAKAAGESIGEHANKVISRAKAKKGKLSPSELKTEREAVFAKNARAGKFGGHKRGAPTYPSVAKEYLS